MPSTLRTSRTTCMEHSSSMTLCKQHNKAGHALTLLSTALMTTQASACSSHLLPCQRRCSTWPGPLALHICCWRQPCHAAFAASTAGTHAAACAGQPAQAAAMQRRVVVQVAGVHCISVHQCGGDHRDDRHLSNMGQVSEIVHASW